MSLLPINFFGLCPNPLHGQRHSYIASCASAKSQYVHHLAYELPGQAG